MLYWLKLLVTAYAITNTIEAFIPLYLINQLQLAALPISLLIALVYILRLFSGIWTFLVDHRTHLYGLTIALLTTASIISSMLLLTLTDLTYDNVWIWILLTISCLFNGLFYQPLGSLIDSAIIKTLGDYRVLFYGSYVRWSKTTTIVMTGLIGLWMSTQTQLQQEQLNYMLLSIFALGSVLLLLIALLGFVSVEPANAQQLNISDEQAPLLLKNALHLTADQNSMNFPTYRPYSIFGEQLSHISEEDASQLDRMFTNTEESIRPMNSRDSFAPSFYSNTSYHLHHPSSRMSEGVENGNNLSMTLVPMVPYNALALLPLPTPTDPLVAFFSWMRPAQNLEDELLCCGHYNNYYYIQQNNQKMNLWKTQTLFITLLLLGISHALMNSFLFIYVYSILEISMYMIPCLIIVQMTSEMIVSFIIEKWFIHRLNLTLVTTCVHIILIVCAILYPCLKPDHVSTQAILPVLQLLQAAAFQLIWLSGADQVNLIHWSQYDRMKHRSRISALYSSIGPAIGVIIAGYILQQSDQSLEDYTLTFKICIVLFSLSFVVSWGWTSDD